MTTGWPASAALVFASSTGTPLSHSNFRNRVWLPALAAVGLEGIHLHDLGPTGNQLTANAGANLRELMARMGHDSERAALIYLRSTAERQRAFADAVGDAARAELARSKKGSSPMDLPRDGQPVAEKGRIVRPVMAVLFPTMTDVEGPRPVVIVHDPQSSRGDPLSLPRLDACVVEPGTDALAEAVRVDVEAVQLGSDLSIVVRDGTRADHRESFQPVTFAGAEHGVAVGVDIAA